MSKLTFLCLIAFICCVSCSPDPRMGDFSVHLVGGYQLERQSANQIEISRSSTLEVPNKVVEIAWNDRFIVAKQQEIRSRGDFPGDDYPVPVPGKFHYWVVDSAAKHRFGPLSEEEYKKKVEDLGLTKLELKDVYSFENLDPRR